MGGWEIIPKVFLLFKGFEGVAEKIPVARVGFRRRGVRTAEKMKSASDEGGGSDCVVGEFSPA